MAGLKQHIRVDVFRADLGCYQHAGIILMGNTPAGHGFAYHKDYDGPPLDPIHLNYRKDGRSFRLPKSKTLHPVFVDLLPGHWGASLLAAENPEYSTMTAVEKLHYMGSRQAGAFQLRCFNTNGEQVPVRGFKALDMVRDRAVRFYMRDLKSILDDFNRYSLTLHHGGRPKCEFETYGGDRWIAKFNLPESSGKQVDPYNMARMEHTMNLMSAACGIQTVESRVEKLPLSNEDVLLVRRFDTERRNKKKHYYQRVSMVTLTGLDNVGSTKTGRADFLDMLKVVKEHSSAPRDDIQELYRRMIHHAAVNNVDNHLRNFDLMQTESGWRLAPSYDVVPTEGMAAFATSMCRYTHREMDLRFVDHTARHFGIPQKEARQMAHQVVSGVLNYHKYADEAGLEMKDRQFLTEAIRPDKLQHLAQEIEASGALEREESILASATLVTDQGLGQ